MIEELIKIVIYDKTAKTIVFSTWFKFSENFFECVYNHIWYILSKNRYFEI